VLLLLAGTPAEVPPADPLLFLLNGDDDATTRETLLSRLREAPGGPCAALAPYASTPRAMARERAVRVMGDAGCDRLEHYRPYFDDQSAWVQVALLDAVARRHVSGAVPYAIARLRDARRLVTDDGSVTVGQAAEHALRSLTGQPIASDSETAWRSWYGDHGAEPPSAWIASGLQQVGTKLQAGPQERLAALETLARLGETGRAPLATALRREPDALAMEFDCTPEDPPRVMETVPCTLFVRNRTDRPIALAVGEVQVRLTLQEAVLDPPPEPKGAARKSAGAVKPSNPAPPVPAIDPATLSGHFVDLAPGQSLRRALRVGPVQTAGRYQTRARLEDLSVGLLPAATPIEATTTVRFEQ
jgi:hypothetical protein